MSSVQRLLATVLAVAYSHAGFADMVVKEVGSFHIGGRQETLSACPRRHRVHRGAPAIKVDPNGEFEVEQMYVQYVKLASPKARWPILLWHGGGLSGVTWETKPTASPAGRVFLNAGYDVYVSDAVERGARPGALP